MGLLASLRRRFETAYLDQRGFGSGRNYTRMLVDAVGADGLLLDIGCGRGELRLQLQATARYVGLDRYVGEIDGEYTGWDMRPDVIGDGHHLPFADGCCSAVSLMQVLEHVYQPLSVLRETRRVVEPGGLVFVDVPFMHEIHHAPNDYFRYTPFALADLARDAELEVVQIKPSGGYFRTLAYVLESAPTVLAGKSWHARVVHVIVGWPLKLFGVVVRKTQYLLELYDARQTLVCGYHCVFRRPARDEQGDAHV